MAWWVELLHHCLGATFSLIGAAVPVALRGCDRRSLRAYPSWALQRRNYHLASPHYDVHLPASGTCPYNGEVGSCFYRKPAGREPNQICFIPQPHAQGDKQQLSFFRLGTWRAADSRCISLNARS